MDMEVMIQSSKFIEVDTNDLHVCIMCLDSSQDWSVWLTNRYDCFCGNISEMNCNFFGKCAVD